MSLPLLPADRFEEGYESIKDFARKKRLFNSFGALFGYFQRYWYNQVRCLNDGNIITMNVEKDKPKRQHISLDCG